MLVSSCSEDSSSSTTSSCGLGFSGAIYKYSLGILGRLVPGGGTGSDLTPQELKKSKLLKKRRLLKFEAEVKIGSIAGELEEYSPGEEIEVD